ncbi:U11/U12 small nuclear ribonucleoprotein 48 kDa protein isoform X2 [Esox lucius]|uniref:U11/U12 small nuclear ribonucleoprotein 48 kDa protein isoform X2 n=1 Tax=Esox lucius TaxID=8010 RepID=UPI0010BD3D1B|nr:U11/U12 small nuclear ribonucleoprotein 48 kDa protein isoform X2 [Esox lucius]
MEPKEVCPYVPNHRVPSRSMERHKATCRLTQLGYSHEEQAEMYDTSVCYEDTNVTSFTMDKHTQRQVILEARANAPPIRTEGLYSQSDYSTDPSEVPQNYKRATCDLTVADRLALFEYVTREASQQKDQAGATNNEDLYVDLVAKLKKDNDQKEPKSHLELMAEMRDYKRRRQSYRAKNVHITKKSYTEVIREVISVHSAELSSQWKEEREDLVKESRHGSQRRSENRRSASAESHHSQVNSGDRHSSHHKVQRSPERHKDPSVEKSQDPSREKETKKKRKRDSRSPDDKHDRKKKKKKKKDEKRDGK